MTIKQKLYKMTILQKIGAFVVLLAVAAFITVVFLLPYNVRHSAGFTKKNAVLETAWQSEDFIIGKETYAVFTIVSNKQRSRDVFGSDFVHLHIPEKSGIFKNRYCGGGSAFAYTQEKLEAFDYTQVIGTNLARDAENGDMLFCSIIPNDCERVTVNGVPASIYENEVPLNGKQITYKFYYCKYNNANKSTPPVVICYDSHGTAHTVENE